nr:vegetative cell wall protein gp1-like [Aegilops tauschii subsp. strangulata]
MTDPVKCRFCRGMNCMVMTPNKWKDSVSFFRTRNSCSDPISPPSRLLFAASSPAQAPFPPSAAPAQALLPPSAAPAQRRSRQALLPPSAQGGSRRPLLPPGSRSPGSRSPGPPGSQPRLLLSGAGAATRAPQLHFPRPPFAPAYLPPARGLPPAVSDSADFGSLQKKTWCLSPAPR